MGQDSTKVLMGSTISSDKKGIEAFGQDPATFIAGLAVRLKSDGTLSVTKADGRWMGISLGRSLSDEKHTSVLKAGLGVPVLLEVAPARGIVTITSYANLVATTPDTLKIGATVFTAQSGSVTPGGSTFQAATSNNATAASLAAQINAHATAGVLYKAVAVAAVVTITAFNNATLGSAIDLVYTDNHSDIGLTTDHATFTGGGTTASDYVVKGAHVYFSDSTGKADDPNSQSTVSNAIYISGVLTGIDEDGNSVQAALVDMGGGL